VYKKRWYDGLHDIYEDKNEFEIKFGCFGGDGGGSKSGPKKDPDPDPTPTPTPAPDDGFRSEQSAAAKAAAEAAKAEVEANLAGKAQTAQNIQNQIADVISGTQKGPVSLDTSMQNMTMDQALGLSVPTVTEQLAPTQVGLPGTTVAPAAKSLADMYADAQKAVSNQAFSSLGTQKSQAQKNLEASLNQGIQGAQYSGPTTTGFQGFSPFNPASEGFGVGVKTKFGFAKGGAVQQGIGSIFPYPRRR